MLKKIAFFMMVAAAPLMASHTQQLAVKEQGMFGFELTNDYGEEDEDLALVTDAKFEVSFAGTDIDLAMTGFDHEEGQVIVKINVNLAITNDSIKAVLNGESLPTALLEVGTTDGAVRKDVMGVPVANIFLAVQKELTGLGERDDLGQAQRIEVDGAMFAILIDIEDANLILQAICRSFNQ